MTPIQKISWLIHSCHYKDKFHLEKRDIYWIVMILANIKHTLRASWSDPIFHNNFIEIKITYHTIHLFKVHGSRNSLVVQWLKPHDFIAHGVGSVPGQGTKILQTVR